MADVTLNIRHNADQATSSVKSLSNAMGSFASNSKKAATFGTAAANGFKKIGQACLSAGRSATKGASGLSKFASSIGRIAFYRAIRSAIRYVTDSFKQGLEAAYNWSKEQGGANAKLAGAMDALSAASGRMKLQLGAAFGGLIVAIEPILIRIINLVTQAAEAITRFFAVLNGTGYYKKAAEGFEEVGNSAGGAGKKIKGLLASWDELNVIGKESGGGGGGSSATDYSGAYVWAEAESDWANLFQTGDFFGIGAKIGEALGNILGKFDEWLQKVRELHLGTKLAEIINGFFSDPNLFKNAGETLADTLIVVVEAVGDFLENVNWEYIKNAFVTFAKSFFGRINDELSNPENFGEGPDFKPYWNLLDELWRKDPNNVNPDGSSKKWYDGIKEDLERMWEDTKTSFGEVWEMISEKWGLIIARIKDLPAHAKQAGISFANNLISYINLGLNNLAETWNNSTWAKIFGKVEPITIPLIPGLTDEELNYYYNEYKKKLEEKNKNNPPKASVEVVEPPTKLGPEKFFSHGKPTSTGYAYEIGATPKLDNPIDPTTIFGGGKTGGKNTGVYSTNTGLALALGVVPQLGDRSKLTDPMNKYVVRNGNPWSAYVNPIYNTGKNFFDLLQKYITGKVWASRVNPIYNTGKDFFNNLSKYITGKVWASKVNPIYNTGKDFFNNLSKYITGKVWASKVNPIYNTGKDFFNNLSKYITGKVWASKVNPIYNTGKDFFDNLSKYITGKVWPAGVNPKYGSDKTFFSTFDEKITGKVWESKVNPKYGSDKTFFSTFDEKITGKVWESKVNPKYGSDKTFFSTFDEKITGKTYSTIVNPKLSVPQTYKTAMGDLTDTKTVKIKPELTDAKAFKEQLQSTLKASASIKTTVSGTTQTIGKVSMSEYAQGGWPNIGDLFIANEAGPELVGTIGGSTAVANNDDIVQGIQGGVERANAEQNELLRNIYSGVVKLLEKDLTISPSVALGQVMARSAALYGRA